MSSIIRQYNNMWPLQKPVKECEWAGMEQLAAPVQATAITAAKELHCWVSDNIRAKWQNVVRQPLHLPGLSSGYHAPRDLINAVLRAVGVKLEDLAPEAAVLEVSSAAGTEQGCVWLHLASHACSSDSSVHAVSSRNGALRPSLSTTVHPTLRLICLVPSSTSG